MTMDTKGKFRFASALFGVRYVRLSFVLRQNEAPSKTKSFGKEAVVSGTCIMGK